MWALYEAVIGWLFRTIVVKFLIFTALFALVDLLIPFIVRYLGNFLDTSALSSAFSLLPSGVWYFIDLFRLDFGLPLIISAFVARFLIRRLPLVG